MGVGLDQYRARIGCYQQPAQHKKSNEKQQMVQLKKVDHDLPWKYTQVALVVLYITLCYWVLILNAVEHGQSQSSTFPTPGPMQESAKSIGTMFNGTMTVNQLNPLPVYEIWQSTIMLNNSVEWSDDDPWRHVTVAKTCNLLCSGDIEENPGPTIGRRDQLEILRYLLSELLSDAAYQRLVRHVRQSGLKFRPDHRVPKDGNCMFHAISDQLLHIDGQDTTHDQLRHDIVNYLRSNPLNHHRDHLRMYVADQDWDKYLAAMSRDGTWGDHIVLQTMATRLHREIRIISSVETDNYEIVLSPMSANPTRPPLLLGHLAENHYYSLAERTVLGLKRSTSMDSLITNIPSKKRKIIRSNRLSSLDLDEGVRHFSSAPLLDLTNEFQMKTMESIRSEHVKLLQAQLKETKAKKQQFETNLEVVRRQTELQEVMVHSLRSEVTRLNERNEHAQRTLSENRLEIHQLQETNKSLASNIYDLLAGKEKLASQLAMKERQEDLDAKVESKEETGTQTMDTPNVEEIQQLQMEKEQLLELQVKRCEDTIDELHKELERLINKDHSKKPTVNREKVEESPIDTKENGPDTPILNEGNSSVDATTVPQTKQLQKSEDPTERQPQSADDNEIIAQLEDGERKPQSDINETKPQSEDDNERMPQLEDGKTKAQSEDNNETKTQLDNANERDGHRHDHTVKLVFLGKMMAGKTSLKRTLQKQSSRLVSEGEPRTLSCEIDDWKIQHVVFKTYDFGGNKDYTSAHPLFLSPQGMHLLVIDLSKYNEDDFSDHIGDWLETLYTHVPFEHFSLVGTHADEISKSKCEEKVKAIKKKVTEFIENRIEHLDLQKMEIEDPEANSGLCSWPKQHLKEVLDKCRSLKISAEDHQNNLTLHVVSCSETLQGIEDLTNYLTRQASKVENRDEVEEISPQIVSRFSNCLTKREDSRLCWVTNEESRQVAKDSGLDNDQKYLKVMQYLYHTGSILCYNLGKDDSELVFYNPAGIIDFVNVLFSGPAEECRPGHCLQAQKQRIENDLIHKSSLTLQQIKDLLKAIYRSATKNIPWKDLLEVCARYGICYQVAKHPDMRSSQARYWFPYHLSEWQPDDITSKIDQFENSDAEHLEVLFQVKFGRSQFFERYCASTNQIEDVGRTWKNGALLWTTGNHRIPILIKKDTQDQHETNVSIKTWGITQTQEKIDTNSSRLAMWKAMANQIFLLECLLHSRPGVKFGIFVVCQCSECKKSKPNGEGAQHFFEFCWDKKDLGEHRAGRVICPVSNEVVPENLVVPPTDVSHQHKPHGKAKEVLSCKLDHPDIEDFIRDNYVNFTDNLEVDSVIPYLIKERILRRADKQKILKKDTQEEQTGELLDILSRKEQTEQTALIDMLDVAPQYRKKRAVEAGVSSSQDDVSETAANPDQADGKPVCSNPTGTPPATMARAPGSRKPRILLVHDEYGTSHGGISTINCEVGQLTAKDNQADVSCTVVHAPNLKDQRDAQNDHVQLIEPHAGAGPRNSKDPSKDWLYYHQEHYPDLPKDVDCVIGHVDITDQAARKIQKDRYPQAKLITINHVIREKTEAYKGGRRPVDAWRREMDVLKEVTEEDVVFSVGKRIYNHYSTVYKGGKRPKSHQIFLPKPSDIFLNATVEVGIDGQLVVLSVGRVKEAERLKGHDLAAGSMGIVAEKIKDAAWRVCGINKDDYAASKKILEDNLKSGNLKPTLVEYGTQEDICANMKMAHLVLMPSRAEPFGLVGLEAIAAGIPVLISDKSGLADLIKDLIKDGKCSADMRHRIVETSVNETDLDKDAKKWADKILDTLENIGAEFENAAKYKKELMDSKYWVKSHQAFLQEACGITATCQ